MNLLNQTKIKKTKVEKGSDSDPFSTNILQKNKNDFNKIEEIKLENKAKSDQKLIQIDKKKSLDFKYDVYSLSLINCEEFEKVKIKPRKQFLIFDYLGFKKIKLENEIFSDIFYLNKNSIIVNDDYLLLSFLEFFFKNELNKKNIENYNIFNLKNVPRSKIEPSDYILYRNKSNCFICPYFDFNKNICKL